MSQSSTVESIPSKYLTATMLPPWPGSGAGVSDILTPSSVILSTSRTPAVTGPITTAYSTPVAITETPTPVTNLITTTEAPVSCGTLTDPPNGEVDYSSTAEGSVAMYTCDPDYPLVGSDMRVCQSNGTWTSDEPRCGCGHPPGIANGTAQWNGVTSTNGTVSYTCDSGYELSNNTILKCSGSSGSWKPAPPTCSKSLFDGFSYYLK